jgi:hypothetical protein
VGPAPAATGAADFPPLAADDPGLVAHYRRFGFVVIKGLLDPAEASSVLAASRELIDNAPVERVSPQARGRATLSSCGNILSNCHKIGSAPTQGGTVDKHNRPCVHPGAYSFTDPVKADDARTYLVPGQGLVLNRISSPMPMAPPFRHASATHIRVVQPPLDTFCMRNH